MGPLLPGAAETSEATQRMVDEEVRRIVETAHSEVSELLRSHRSNLDALANTLLERETLDEAGAYAAAGLSRDSAATEPAGLLGAGSLADLES
jgi:cell division protease FtsH